MDAHVPQNSEDPYYISGLDQIRAVSSPVRQDIVDAVAVIGPCSVSELGDFLDLRPDSLYYHVRVLRDLGILLEASRVNPRGQSIATYDVPGRPVFLRYELSTREGAAALSRYAAAMLRSAQRGFSHGIKSDEVVAEGPARNLRAARWKGWLSADELREVNQLLGHLIRLFRRGQPRGAEDGKLYELTFVLAPSSGKLSRDEPAAVKPQ